MTKLRVLVEVDGKTVTDIDKEVQSVNFSMDTEWMDVSRDDDAFIRREPTGGHSIHIDYKDKR